MPKIIFEDKIDPITCSEVERTHTIYYASGDYGDQYNQYIPHEVCSYSTTISYDDIKRIRNSDFRVIGHNNKTLYNNCIMVRISTDQNKNISKIYFEPRSRNTFSVPRHQLLFFDTSNMPYEHVNCHSHESCGFQSQ